jgi:hexosaminidase
MQTNYYSLANRSPRRICQSLLLLFAITTSVCSATQKTPRRQLGLPAPGAEISIIPQPASVVVTNGYFEFSKDTKVIAADPDAVKAATALNILLQEKYGFKLKETHDASAENVITFSKANVGHDQSGANEGYSLKIKPGAVEIRGSERGMFYGIQSLLQLFPPASNGEANLPAADITDAPRFRYRGMHLDVARHFMPVAFVKKFINLISRYKYNYFHWHLTDDQGWRIEIQKYPRLTEVGSKRGRTEVGKVPTNGDITPEKDFYDQDQIRKIVAYAKERYVTIIPEIDLPGHSTAALASYPEFGCHPPYQVQTTWKASTNAYCPKESTIHFIEDVLSEVIGLFPDSPYIHLGGDEVLKGSWSNRDLKQANLASEKEAQRWFIERIGRYINSKERKIIVWDDMVDFGVPPDTTVMYWRNSDFVKRVLKMGPRPVTNAVKAAREKHEVIMTPDDFLYFDHRHGDHTGELSFYQTPTPLDKVYNFEPVPAGLEPEAAKYIIGAEGCLWTELLKTSKDVEYMMFPRALALAEVLWSKRENKNPTEFSNRLAKEFPKLDREAVNRCQLKACDFDDQRNPRITTPEPTRPAPTKPGPTKPGPTKAGPTKSEPTKLGPTKPGSMKPGLTKPGPHPPIRRKEPPSI